LILEFVAQAKACGYISAQSFDIPPRNFYTCAMPETNRAPFDWKASLPYFAPFILFMLFTAGIEPRAGAWYPVVYTAKLLAVAVVLAFFWRRFDELRAAPNFRAIALGVLVGLVVFVEWAWMESRELVPPLPLTGKRAEYNPFDAIASDSARTAFIGVRLFGMALLVPVMEELLWRSWLLRLVVREDFKRVPIGTFTWASCLISAGVFALTHPEWLSAFLCGLAYNFVLYRTKNLWACIVAHATTNLALGVYVLTTGTWKLW
jgi:CAAX prenyl protease-like protein